MPYEALLWSLAALIAPLLVRPIWPRLIPRLGRWREPLEALGPWVHGFGPAYMALISGAIISREAGLRGHSPWSWLAGALVCLGWLALLSRVRALGSQWPDPLSAMADEPRWGLYRASGALWLDSHPLGTLAGLGLGLLDWGLNHQPWRSENRANPVVCGDLLRLASSTLLFALTRNFWLTALTQYLWIALRARRPQAER